MDFFSKYNNQFLDYDHAYGNQCVDLIKAYYKEVLNIPPRLGSAIQYWLYPDFQKITNTPINYPKPGDLIIWNYPSYGHIAICQSANLFSFTCFEQNNPIGSPCHSAKHNYKNVLGWLRPIPKPIFPKVPIQIACIGTMPDIASFQSEVSKYSSGKISFNVVQYTKDIKGKIDQASAYNIVDVVNPKEKFVFIFYQGPADSVFYTSYSYPGKGYITTCPAKDSRSLAFEFAHQLQMFYDDNRGSLPFIEITDSNFPDDSFIQKKYDSVSANYN